MSALRQHRRGVLLAGGASSRFGGTPKGLLPFRGGRLADAALAALCESCDDVVIAANDAAAESWFPPHRVVRDTVAGRGALGALETALLASDGAVVTVCAWDMPFVTADVLTALSEAVERGATCCVPEHADGRLEPLCAAYGPLCLSLATALLADGERAAHALLHAAGGRRWRIDEEMQPAITSRTFLNVNTPDELQTAETWHVTAPHHA
jgi:molybdenum cofactor guanylyltransferase